MGNLSLRDNKRALTLAFLRDFKNIATKGRGIDFVPRKKNIESLAKLGLNKKAAKSEILNLSVSDYCDGPKPDTDRSGEVWEFGKEILGKEVYIKLKVAQVKGDKIAKCLSFHIAEFPLCFPLVK